MKKAATLMMLVFTVAAASHAKQARVNDTDFKLALPDHPGQLRWHADGFKIIQSSAKPNDQEIGIRAKDESGRFMFLGFLFVVSGHTSLTSAQCRDYEIEPLRKSSHGFEVLGTSQLVASNGLPISVVTYTEQGQDRKSGYSMRGFIATSDICGDLEFFSYGAINPEDADLLEIFKTFNLDPAYTPKFGDVFLYAEILYKEQAYAAAAPTFEQSLAMLADDKSNLTMRRVTTDQAGMAYGISGDTTKARKIFESAIARDPDYPLYYYNLACADAQDKNLTAARVHLQQAYDRKANMIPGEIFPDPSKDDSFLPYRNNKDFWEFVEGLH